MYKNLNEINGFENCSNYIIYSDGKMFNKSVNSFLTPLKDTKGYFYYDFRSQNTSYKCPKVHRLVMMAFSNEEPQPQINHKDGDKSNNDISNLEWCDNDENRKHALDMGLKDEIQFGIAQYDLNDNLLYIWHTAADAMEWLGKNRRQSGKIGRVVRGKDQTYCGYKWKQYENYDFNHPEKYANQTFPQKATKPKIAMCDMDENILKVFDTQADAMEYLNKPRKRSSSISAVINGYKKSYLGYKWKEI